MHQRQKIGIYGEQLAEKYFTKKGYKILARRFQTRHGEIDLIVVKDKAIAFVEIKTRTTTKFGHPEEAVNYHKIKKMRITARQYITKNNIIDQDLRLDCIAIELNLYKKTAQIRHYENIS